MNLSRRALLLGGIAAVVAVPLIRRALFSVASPPRHFALVYERDTKQPRRVIDTTDDWDDSHLLRARDVLLPDEVMEAFPIADFPVRFPRFVAPFIGTGEFV